MKLYRDQVVGNLQRRQKSKSIVNLGGWTEKMSQEMIGMLYQMEKLKKQLKWTLKMKIGMLIQINKREQLQKRNLQMR